MKKLMGRMSALVLLASLLSACAATPAATPTQPPAVTPTSTPIVTKAPEATPQPTAETPAEWPKTIVDGAGNTIVFDKKPERISLLHVVYMEYLLMLDTPPTAAALGNALGQMESLAQSEMFAPYLGDADIKMLGNSRDLSLEAVLESDPDVIITFYSAGGLATYDQLVKIAPVVQMDFSLSWQEQLLMIADILGKRAEGEAHVARLEAKIADTKAALETQSDKTFALFRTDGKTFIAQGQANYYNAFGLTKPEGFPSAAGTAGNLTLEGLATMNPTYIVFQHNQEIAQAFVDSMATNTVWQSLDAVKNNRVFYFDENMNSFGPMALDLAADKLMEIYAD